MTAEEHKKMFFEMSLMWAQWWMHAASNGHATTREVVRGDDHKLTQDELRDDAMNTAKTHLHNARNVMDS